MNEETESVSPSPAVATPISHKFFPQAIALAEYLSKYPVPTRCPDRDDFLFDLAEELSQAWIKHLGRTYPRYAQPRLKALAQPFTDEVYGWAWTGYAFFRVERLKPPRDFPGLIEQLSRAQAANLTNIGQPDSKRPVEQWLRAVTPLLRRKA